jgi:hypothetical protein
MVDQVPGCCHQIYTGTICISGHAEGVSAGGITRTGCCLPNSCIYVNYRLTAINWGSSYLVNDFYGRFYNPDATEKQKVRFGRISTVSIMVCSVLLALVLQNALQAFQYLLMIGAGTGLIYILGGSGGGLTPSQKLQLWVTGLSKCWAFHQQKPTGQ